MALEVVPIEALANVAVLQALSLAAVLQLADGLGLCQSLQK